MTKIGTHELGSEISLPVSTSPITCDDKKPAALPIKFTKPKTTEVNWPDKSAVIGLSPMA